MEQDLKAAIALLEAELFHDNVPHWDCPKTVICPYGVFQSDGEGNVKVFDFDDDGNWYDLPQSEQDRRVALWRAALEAK